MTYRVNFIVNGIEHLSIYVDADNYGDAIEIAEDRVEEESYLGNVLDWELDDVEEE